LEHRVSGIGVLDKSVALVDAVGRAEAPCTLGELVAATGLPKPTAHRLAVALEAHGLLRRDADGRFALGLRLVELGRAAADDWPLADAARPALASLRDDTEEGVQLYVRDGDSRVCLVSLESPHELRTIVPEGARLPLGVGSAGRLLRGDLAPDGWLASVEERARGVVSVSALVHGPAGEVVAAVGISGPIDRLGTDPGARHGKRVVRAASEISLVLAQRG
jgi:DNA-binding IclR family transcriptional regulator